MYQQIPLNLHLREEASFESFVAVGNEALLHKLNDRGEQYIYLWGDKACGKTHLLQALCHQSWRQQQMPAYIPLADSEISDPDIFLGLEAMDLVCIDDIQVIAGKTEWETALFHLFNRVKEQGGRLIVSATRVPNRLQIGLADLVSRLNWGLVFQVMGLQDRDKLAVLQLRASQLGLELPLDIAEYMLKRSPRDMASLFDLLNRLDMASLTEQRRLTIPFVRQYL